MVRFLGTKRFLKFFAAMSFVDSFSLQLFMAIMPAYTAYANGLSPKEIAQLMVTFGLGMLVYACNVAFRPVN